jgi:outer membrane protein assembly factor BamD
MKKLFLLFFWTFIFSCAKKENPKTNNAETSYLEAYKLLKQKSYDEAADKFEKISDEFPFSKWALKAGTMSVYARYKDENYSKLLLTADDFLRLSPNSDYVPYMLYMKGLSYYNQIPEINRAQDNTQQASFTFRELITRFPETTYAADAKEKLDFIDEHLAGAKMSVGRSQIKNHNYIGAIISFKEVIERYQRSKQIAEAYFRLTEIYYKIGLKTEAGKAYKNLQKKFPDSQWSKMTQKFDFDF